VDALYVISDPIANTNRIRINTLALGARLPTMLGTRNATKEAGLMSYGPNNADLFTTRRRLCRQDSARREAW
jgi:putative ABC transport system substrate-binding protein